MTVRRGFVGANTIAREYVLNAVRGDGVRSATREDGVWSLATALALVESARSGRTARVETGIAAP